jgi:hypothetical protein
LRCSMKEEPTLLVQKSNARFWKRSAQKRQASDVLTCPS